ncbi:MAG: hypothetical protein ABSB25_05530 [Sedimentisphaerales bacterium]
MREQFKDNEGISELGMLASPTAEELGQLRRAVAIMTAQEKQNAANLTDDQVRKIADDAKVDPALFAIFINGYALHAKRRS